MATNRVPPKNALSRWWPAGVLTLLSLLTLGMGANKGASNGPPTIEAVYETYGFPLPCDAATPWEGKTITVQGRIDANNIFNKQRYPQLPYEKFKLVGKTGAAVEIWPQASDNRAIFEKLDKRPSDDLIVQGRLASFKMPMSGACRMGLKMVIDHEDQIQFEAD